MRKQEDDIKSRMRNDADAVSSQDYIKSALKRVVDIIGSIIFFVLFGPLYVLLWWLVLLTTGGPAVYKHKRVGRNGREFNCLKFRSMVINSDEVLKDLLATDLAALNEWNTTFKLKEDPRITKFGRFIRKSSLDELPQFWNVLRGDMSLVGPRPVVRKELDLYYGPYAHVYTLVRPGITGPWQVGGRSDLSYAERVALDTNYVRGWTVIGDFLLIAKTVTAVFKRRGSY